MRVLERNLFKGRLIFLKQELRMKADTDSNETLAQGGDNLLSIRNKENERFSNVLKLRNLEHSIEIEKLKASYEKKQDEMQKRIQDLEHNNRILDAQLTGELKMKASSEISKTKMIQAKLAELVEKQAVIERTNAELVKCALDFKNVLNEAMTDYESAHDMKEKDIVSLKDYVKFKLYHFVKNYRDNYEEEKSRSRNYEKQLINYDQRLENLKNDYRNATDENGLLKKQLAQMESDREVHKETAVACRSSHNDYEELKSGYKQFKEETRILRQEMTSLKQHNERLQYKLANVSEEKTRLDEECRVCKAELRALQSKLSEAGQELTKDREYVKSLQEEIEILKSILDNLHKEYTTYRNNVEVQMENKVKEELLGFKRKADERLCEISYSLQSEHENEIRAMRKRNDDLLQEKKVALQSEKESFKRLDGLLKTYWSYKNESKSIIEELEKALDQSLFERDKLKYTLNQVSQKTTEYEQTCKMYNNRIQKLEDQLAYLRVENSRLSQTLYEDINNNCNENSDTVKVDHYLKSLAKNIELLEKKKQNLLSAINNSAHPIQTHTQPKENFAAPKKPLRRIKVMQSPVKSCNSRVIHVISNEN